MIYLIEILMRSEAGNYESYVGLLSSDVVGFFNLLVKLIYLISNLL